MINCNLLLLVKGEISDIDRARRNEESRWNPKNISPGINDDVGFEIYFVDPVGVVEQHL